jgi:hypothetical protein
MTIGERFDLRRQIMTGKIDPEAMEPSTMQPAVLSNRNPEVSWRGAEVDGGEISPAPSEQRVTPEGPAVSPDTGLKY